MVIQNLGRTYSRKKSDVEVGLCPPKKMTQTNGVTLSLLELVTAARINDIVIFRHILETYLHPPKNLKFNTFTLIIPLGRFSKIVHT